MVKANSSGLQSNSNGRQQRPTPNSNGGSAAVMTKANSLIAVAGGSSLAMAVVQR